MFERSKRNREADEEGKEKEEADVLEETRKEKEKRFARK